MEHINKIINIAFWSWLLWFPVILLNFMSYLLYCTSWHCIKHSTYKVRSVHEN